MAFVISFNIGIYLAREFDALVGEPEYESVVVFSRLGKAKRANAS
jgi:hypothetical protein